MNASLTQLVLRWTMQMPGITTVLAGARNPEQVQENAGALNFHLTEEEIKILRNELKEAQNAPIFGFNCQDMTEDGLAFQMIQRVREHCHRIALEHRLPEINGFYGLDEDGEFIRK
jgi:hypothetical protein